MNEEINKYFLLSCEIFVGIVPTEVITVLGSCISVCLWDTKLNIGGINHYMLPLWNGNGLASSKYGDIAIIKLIEKMKEFGCEQKNIVSKIFGGASVVENKIVNISIGENNILIAQNLLKKHHIPIVASSVKGTKGRKIRYNTNTSEVLMKYVGNKSLTNNSNSESISETFYSTSLKKEKNFNTHLHR